VVLRKRDVVPVDIVVAGVEPGGIFFLPSACCCSAGRAFEAGPAGTRGIDVQCTRFGDHGVAK
jgi:hypothetical protein